MAWLIDELWHSYRVLCLLVYKHPGIKSGELWELYKEWLREHSLHVPSYRAFQYRMRTLVVRDWVDGQVRSFGRGGRTTVFTPNYQTAQRVNELKSL